MEEIEYIECYGNYSFKVKIEFHTMQEEHTILHSHHQFHSFQHCYRDISIYIKSIRHAKLPVEGTTLDQLKRIGGLMIGFLSGSKAYQHSLFGKPLIAFDNALNINNQFLREAIESDRLLMNLNSYFIEMCTAERTKGIQLYSVLYLVVMLMYEANRRQESDIFRIKLMNDKFIDHFLKLELVKGYKVEKLMGIIVAFIVKSFPILRWSGRLRRFLLANLHLAVEDKVQFYFFYGLRAVRNDLSLTDIRKSNLLNFIMGCFKAHSGSLHAYYLYDLLHSMLRKYPILGFELLSMELHLFLERNLTLHDKEIFRIFEALKPCLSPEVRATSLQLHLQKFMSEENDSTSRMVSLKMLTLLSNDLTVTDCLGILESSSFSFLLECLNLPNSTEEKLSLSFLEKFLHRLRKEDANLSRLLKDRLSILPVNPLSIRLAYFVQKVKNYSPQPQFILE